MSSSIYWKPKSSIGNLVSGTRLKGILQDKFGHNFTLDDNDLAWLEGLSDSGVEGSNDLRNAIHDSGTISISIE